MKYVIYATVLTELELEIDADSLEQAISIADDDELVSADFECTSQDFNLELIRATDSDEEFIYPRPINRDSSINFALVKYCDECPKLESQCECDAPNEALDYVQEITLMGLDKGNK